MIVAEPADTPVTIPELRPMVAIVVSLLLHVPPVVPSVRVIVEPTHTRDGPVIGIGAERTVSVEVI